MRNLAFLKQVFSRYGGYLDVTLYLKVAMTQSQKLELKSKLKASLTCDAFIFHSIATLQNVLLIVRSLNTGIPMIPTTTSSSTKSNT